MLVSSPTTTSATLWSTRKPSQGTHQWKCHSQHSDEDWGHHWWWQTNTIPKTPWSSTMANIRYIALRNVLPQMPSPSWTRKVHAMEDIPIGITEYTIVMKMDTMTETFNVYTFQKSNAIDPSYGGFQTAWTYTIHADNPPPYTPMNFPPPNAPTGPNCW